MKYFLTLTEDFITDKFVFALFKPFLIFQQTRNFYRNITIA